MGEERKTPITIDDKEYIYEEMTSEQQTLVNHINDLNRKISNTEFNLDQLLFGRKAFIDALKQELE